MSDEKSTPTSPEPNSEPAPGIEPTRSFQTSYDKDAPTTPATRVLPEDEAGDPERSELTTGPSLSETGSPASISLSKDRDDAPVFGTAGFDETPDADRYTPESSTSPSSPAPPPPRRRRTTRRRTLRPFPVTAHRFPELSTAIRHRRRIR